ncbi:MAG: hypothetical protein JWM71_686, partial [Solirubrobacteraceae bacterium]|nr:hypothetical protein [Solirubrobacteraceae bacterium]
RSGGREVVSGFAAPSLIGKKVKIAGDHGAGSGSATVGKDSSFSARFPAPKSDQTSYRASYGSSRSSPLKVSRNLTIVSEKAVAGGLKVTARHSKGKRVAGQTVNVLRQTSCGKQSRFATARFDKRGEVTVVLPAPKPPDTIAVYRLNTKTNSTFTLPIVVRR